MTPQTTSLISTQLPYLARQQTMWQEPFVTMARTFKDTMVQAGSRLQQQVLAHCQPHAQTDKWPSMMRIPHHGSVQMAQQDQVQHKPQ